MVVDVIAGVILLASTVISILRGFIREVLTIFGIVGGSVAAYVGGPLLSPVIKGWMGIDENADAAQNFLDTVPYPMVAEGISYIAIFVAFVIILSVMSYFLAESIKNIGLGALDRTLGMVFGLVRGVFFLGLLYLPVYYLVDDGQMEEWSWLKSSRSRIYLEATSAWIAGFIPVESVESIAQATEEFGQVNEARKKLQEMNLLGTNISPDGSADNDSLEVAPQGYTDEFRSKMDELIERTTEE